MNKIKIAIKLIFFGVLLGAACYKFQPVIWKSSAVIRLSGVESDLNNKAFESILVTSSRLKNYNYLISISKRAKYQESKTIILHDLISIKSLSTKEDWPTIELSISTKNPKIAFDVMSAIYKELKDTHDGFTEKYMESINELIVKIPKGVQKGRVAGPAEIYYEEERLIEYQLIEKLSPLHVKYLELIAPIDVTKSVIFPSLEKAIAFCISLCFLIYLIRVKLVFKK